MIALYIILGIIVFFIAVLSVRLKLNFDYNNTVECYAQWLFLKIPLYPGKEKKKPEKEKEPKPKEEKPAEKKEEKPKEKKSGDNIFKQFYNNKGIDGIVELLTNVMASLDRLSRRIVHCFVLNDFYLRIIVTGDDAADTAIKYGKYCSYIFPVLGNIISRCNVKKYDVDISPDYLANKGSAELMFNMSVIPRKLINSVVMMAFDMLFNVALKFLKGIKGAKKSSKPAEKKENSPASGEKEKPVNNSENIENTEESGV